MKKWFLLAMSVFMSLSLMSGTALSAKKDQLLIGMPGDPTTFDPHIRLGLPMLQSWPLVFDNILARDIKGKNRPRPGDVVELCFPYGAGTQASQGRQVP